MDSDFDVPTRTPAPKPAAGEPITDPRGRKSATTPASSKEIAQAAEKRQAGYKEPAPEAPTATTVPDATPDLLPEDLRKAVLRACRTEASALLQAYEDFQKKDALMYGIIDAESARRRRDALFENGVDMANFREVMEQWVLLSVISSKPDGYGLVLRSVELWRFREFEATIEAARSFYKKINEEVEKIKERAVAAETSFFAKLFRGRAAVRESHTSKFISETCSHLTHVGPAWDQNLKDGIRATGFSSAVLAPGALLELAQEAVSLPA